MDYPWAVWGHLVVVVFFYDLKQVPIHFSCLGECGLRTFTWVSTGISVNFPFRMNSSFNSPRQLLEPQRSQTIRCLCLHKSQESDAAKRKQAWQFCFQCPISWRWTCSFPHILSVAAPCVCVVTFATPSAICPLFNSLPQGRFLHLILSAQSEKKLPPTLEALNHDDFCLHEVESVSPHAFRKKKWLNHSRTGKGSSFLRAALRCLLLHQCTHIEITPIQTEQRSFHMQSCTVD